MQIELSVPALLADCLGGTPRAMLEAITLQDALDDLAGRFPLLLPHIYEPDIGTRNRAIRKHVLIYLNDESITWLDDWNRPLKPGDRLQILQAISGG